MAYEEKKESGQEDDKKILEDCRACLKECVEEENGERAKMLDDLRFCALDQWPSDVRKERESDVENGQRPCLTIDKINQYIVQIINDIRQGRPGINVRPQDDKADVETAKILKGIVRNIEDQSNADIPYSVAAENAVKIGLGYFRITTEYVSDDSFDQEIFIRPIPNTFSVYLGKHIMPDGSDAERGYITETMPVAKFKQMFPKAKHEESYFADLDATIAGYWRTKETITVVEEYCIERKREELLFLEDGTTITATDYENWPEEAGQRPAVQERRSTMTRQLKWRKMTGCEVLEKRDLPGQWIPIVEVVGREAWVEGKRCLWGVVRPAKDSLRMYNYWASTITERMALTPKQPYIGAKGQFEGLEEKWKKANRVNAAYLEYNPIDVNGNAIPAPQRQGPTPMEAALLQQMQVIEHDVQTSLGMYKAAVGQAESQQSGRAILALQRESDTGTFHFGANLGVSIRHAGRIIVDLIPHYYDTRRIVRILGEDGEVQSAVLDPTLQVAHQKTGEGQAVKSIYNPGVGRYDVSITVGPSYNTKRMEAAATFVELAKGAADPGTAAVLAYLTVQNSDFNGSTEAGKMLRAMLPPQVQQVIASDGPIPPQAMAQMQQMMARLQQMGEAGQKLQEENQKLRSGEQSKMAQVSVSAQEAQAELNLAKQKQDAEIALAREKAEAEIALKRAVAEAEMGLKRQQDEFERECRMKDEQAKMAEESMKKGNDFMGAALPQVAESMQAIVQMFAQALQAQMQQQSQGQAQIVESLQARKHISMTLPDGRKASADVTVN